MIVVFFLHSDAVSRDRIMSGAQTCVFFFSSRRRHTRSDRDWSSDVCSSDRSEEHTSELQSRSDLVCRLLLVTGVQTCALPIDRKSTRLNSSHDQISYAVFCLKKKNKHITLDLKRRNASDDLLAYAVYCCKQSHDERNVTAGLRSHIAPDKTTQTIDCYSQDARYVYT